MSAECCRGPWKNGSCFRPASNVTYEVNMQNLLPETRRVVAAQGASFKEAVDEPPVQTEAPEA